MLVSYTHYRNNVRESYARPAVCGCGKEIEDKSKAVFRTNEDGSLIYWSCPDCLERERRREEDYELNCPY